MDKNLMKTISNEFLAVMLLGNLCDEKFNYSPTQLSFWAEQIAGDYPGLGSDKLKKVITNGFKGRYKGKYEGSTNLAVVIGWIDRFLEDERVFNEAKAKSDYKEECDKAYAMRMNIDQYREYMIKKHENEPK